VAWYEQAARVSPSLARLTHTDYASMSAHERRGATWQDRAASLRTLATQLQQRAPPALVSCSRLHGDLDRDVQASQTQILYPKHTRFI
jgi:hypothetical protein